jgi:hypothetical protein
MAPVSIRSPAKRIDRRLVAHMANARRYACAAVVGNDSESVEAKDLHDFGRRN